MTFDYTSLGAGIFGMLGTRLTDAETRFFKEIRPYGFILFARNLTDPGQVKTLTDSLREVAGRKDVLILIDQEGGRVARLKPPHWRKAPPARLVAALAKTHLEEARELVYMNARLIAQELHALGINTDCVPLADVPVAGSHDIIGDRAFSEDPQIVATLADAMARGVLDGGVLPVVKHIPGHGRAKSDSHEHLPEVDASFEELDRTDFLPFKKLNHYPLGMTAHVRYTAIDPKHCATLSPKCIQLIRDHIGFDGLLMSDDLSMKALEGDFASRTRDSIAAGCDLVLHCNGDMAEMEAVAKAMPTLSAKGAARAASAQALLKAPAAFDYADASAKLERHLSAVA